MVVTWLIEQYLFDEYEQDLINKINSNPNSRCILYDYQQGADYKKELSELLPNDSPVIFHGSLQLGRRIEKYLSCYPGIYLTLDNYECHKYYGYYGNMLLNSNYTLIGLNDVLRNKNELLKKHSVGDVGGNVYIPHKVFIRPSNGFKSFTGQLLSTTDFNTEIDVLKKTYGGIDETTLVLLSSAIQLKEEYRFIVVDGKVVSGAIYFDENNRNSHQAYYDKPINVDDDIYQKVLKPYDNDFKKYTDSEFDELCDIAHAIEFANILANKYQPDRAFNMDIVRLPSGRYKLVEINSFCCGSLYGNDLVKVVNSINELCIKDWKDIYN